MCCVRASIIVTTINSKVAKVGQQPGHVKCFCCGMSI